MLRQWVLSHYSGSVGRQSELDIWDIQIIYKGLWRELELVTEIPLDPDPGPEDPLGPLIQSVTPFDNRVRVLEHLVTDLVELAAASESVPDLDLLSKDNVFGGLGDVDGRKEALESQIERLDEARALAKSQLEDL